MDFGVTSISSSSRSRKRAVERHADRRRQLYGFILAGGADVGQLLALQNVHFEIVIARVNADNHAGINLLTRLDDHRATIFELNMA